MMNRLMKNERTKIPTKCARKNKNIWFKDCLGLINFLMSLCIPYPNTISKTSTIKRVILCND